MTVRVGWRAWSLVALVFAVVSTGLGMSVGFDPPDVVPVGVFSEMDSSQTLPDGWEFISMAAAFDETTFDLVSSDRGVVLQARSNNGAAALLTERRIDPTTHPILKWHWKIDSIVEKGKLGVKSRDDFPARLYVAFDYDLTLYQRLKRVAFRALGYQAVGKRAIVYIWGNRAKRGTVLSSPYVGWHKLMVVRSGSTHTGVWRTERRNVRRDYYRIFGEEPPPVEMVAIMTDTENTGGHITAHYGDIVFRAVLPDSAVVDTTLYLRSGNSE